MWMKLCTMVDIHDVITSVCFGDDRLRGLGMAGGQILAFPIDFDRRPYNSLALPCDVTVTLSHNDTVITWQRYWVTVIMWLANKRKVKKCAAVANGTFDWPRSLAAEHHHHHHHHSWAHETSMTSFSRLWITSTNTLIISHSTPPLHYMHSKLSQGGPGLQVPEVALRHVMCHRTSQHHSVHWEE